MKKLYFLFITFGSISLKIIAQPILTAEGINPVAGDNFIIHSALYVSPGDSGRNQTWDISSLDTNGTFTYQIANASSSTFASSFLNANISINNFDYCKTSSTALQDYGIECIVFDDSVIDLYSDPEDILRFPFSYGDNFTDTYRSSAIGIVWAIDEYMILTTFAIEGDSYYHHTGIRTVIADGYGTLKTPAGTFNNVLRIHYIDISNDTIPAYPSTMRVEGYAWYLNGYHFPLALIDSANGSERNFGSTYYLGNIPNGIDEQSNTLNSLHLSPNPATNQLSIHTSSFNNDEHATVFIRNLLGQQTSPPTPLLEERGAATIDVSGLSAGIYFVEVVGENGRWVGKFVKE